ncbi:MAG: hypothetical protein ABIE43_03035 [Patescibacteria group bacterium]
MVSPSLNKKTDNNLTLSENTKKLFQVIYRCQQEDKKEREEVPKIKVSELISKMAFYYEKIRNSVDYDEEYLLRKNAIERILKRHIVIEGAIKVSKSEEISKNLMTELIRAAYLPNDKIPEYKIDEVSSLIEKYIKLRNYCLARINPSSQHKNEHLSKAKNELNEHGNLTNWIIAIAASEIEESLGEGKAKQVVVVSNMYETLAKNIKLPKDLPYEKDLKIQIYLGIHRNYLKFDRDMLSFILFKYYNSNWHKPKDEEIAKISQNISSLQMAIENQLNHPLTRQLNRIIARYTVFYSILTEVIEGDSLGVFESIKNDAKAFPRLLKKVCERKYKKIKSKLWRAAMRSIIYIFITKSIFAVLIEVPAMKWFGEEVNSVSLGINIGFPAFLLFMVVFLTRLPSDKNTERIKDGINEITFVDYERKEPYLLRKPIKRGKITDIFFGLIYSITFFLSFGLVVWVLDRLGFSFVSIIIFLFFLTFVSFFSTRVRKGVRELIVIEEKESIIKFVLDFFYVPIAVSGKWLSEKFSRLNVFVFILDFIIEVPFKIFIGIAEDWTRYVKERKDEIV